MSSGYRDLTIDSNRTRQTTLSQNGHSHTIPDYEVIDTLGRGGMGVVYKARQLKLGRTVAVKMLDAALRGTRQLERFRDEAHAVARLHHPNIVQIHDVGQADGVPFFCMEIVEGGNLKDRLADGPLDIDEAVQCSPRSSPARSILCILRDSPTETSNPRTSCSRRMGNRKVTDFGLAKRLNDDSGHTKTGEILGTVGYMAPEQLDHSHANDRSANRRLRVWARCSTKC